eukprot:jgi/Botrbrau1/4708/Bobra.0218s0029.1
MAVGNQTSPKSIVIARPAISVRVSDSKIKSFHLKFQVDGHEVCTDKIDLSGPNLSFRYMEWPGIYKIHSSNVHSLTVDVVDSSTDGVVATGGTAFYSRNKGIYDFYRLPLSQNLKEVGDIAFVLQPGDEGSQSLNKSAEGQQTYSNGAYTTVESSRASFGFSRVIGGAAGAYSGVQGAPMANNDIEGLIGAKRQTAFSLAPLEYQHGAASATSLKGSYRAGSYSSDRYSGGYDVTLASPEVCARNVFTTVEERPVTIERIEYVRQPRRFERQYVVEVRYVGEKEVASAAFAEVVGRAERVVEVTPPSKPCAAVSGMLSTSHSHGGRPVYRITAATD